MNFFPGCETALTVHLQNLQLLEFAKSSAKFTTHNDNQMCKIQNYARNSTFKTNATIDGRSICRAQECC
jgi:hypothetical protein